MQILSEKDKDYLRRTNQGIKWLNNFITQFSCGYDDKITSLAKSNRNDPNLKKFVDLNNNLFFAKEVLNEEINKDRIIKNRLKVHHQNDIDYKNEKDLMAKIIGEQALKIDQQNEEIKRLKKLNENLKMNINL